MRYPFSTAFCNYGYTMCHRSICSFGGARRPTCALSTVCTTSLARLRHRGKVTLPPQREDWVKLMKFRQPDFKLKILASTKIWSRTSYRLSYKCFKINIPSHPLNLWKITIKSNELSNTLFLSATIKVEGCKRGCVILSRSASEDGDMFLLSLCALLISVHEIGR